MKNKLQTKQILTFFLMLITLNLGLVNEVNGQTTYVCIDGNATFTATDIGKPVGADWRDVWEWRVTDREGFVGYSGYLPPTTVNTITTSWNIAGKGTVQFRRQYQKMAGGLALTNWTNAAVSANVIVRGQPVFNGSFNVPTSICEGNSLPVPSIGTGDSFDVNLMYNDPGTIKGGWYLNNVSYIQGTPVTMADNGKTLQYKLTADCGDELASTPSVLKVIPMFDQPVITSSSTQVGANAKLGLYIQDFFYTPDYQITWTSSDPANADVDQNGVVTGSVANTTVTVTCKVKHVSDTEEVCVKTADISIQVYGAGTADPYCIGTGEVSYQRNDLSYYVVDPSFSIEGGTIISAKYTRKTGQNSAVVVVQWNDTPGRGLVTLIPATGSSTWFVEVMKKGVPEISTDDITLSCSVDELPHPNVNYKNAVIGTEGWQTMTGDPVDIDNLPDGSQIKYVVTTLGKCSGEIEKTVSINRTGLQTITTQPVLQPGSPDESLEDMITTMPVVDWNGNTPGTTGWSTTNTGPITPFGATSPLSMADNGTTVYYYTSSACGTIYSDPLTLVIIDKPTGIEELNPEGLKLFPNPFRNEVQIQGADGCMLQITNTAGTVVYVKKLTNPSETISTQNLPKGTYLFQLEKDGKVKMIKGIKI